MKQTTFRGATTLGLAALAVLALACAAARADDKKKNEVEGTLTAVNKTANTVVITPRRGAAVTLNVTAATKIERNDKKAVLADLVVGDHVEAKFDPATKNALKLETES